MTFAYVAGFFDGEGHVSVRPNSHRYVIGLTQSTKQDAVLFEIQAFLHTMGIPSHSYVSSGRDVRHLKITKARDVAAFLRGVLPFLIVKRKKAEAALVHCDAITSRQDARETYIDECVREYQAGVSMKELARRHGTTHQRLAWAFRSRGITLRTLREAQLLFLQTASPEFVEQRRQAGLRGNAMRWNKHRHA